MILELMFNTPFFWTIDHDHNRVADGKEFREDFCHVNGIPHGSLDFLGEGNFLEVLLGLSRRLAFSVGGRAPSWAWTLMDNLELHRMGDPLDRRKARKAESIMQTVMNRSYRPDGGGGFFPLTSPQEDQRQVELWYQMSAYISELHPEYR